MNLLYQQEVYRFMGAAMEVHHVLGSGFAEPVYHEALAMECGWRGIPFLSEQQLTVTYKGTTLKKYYIADIVAYDKIIVELKALKELTDKETAQLLNYLKATGFRVGLLINFGSSGKLEWKRLVR
ncbi:MAG: GxxExxY protein [Caldilineaceae bacterium]|nr:GxxExxY protein [Caldilineaceae bacterium]